MLRGMQLEGHGAGRVARDGVHVLHYGARAPQAAACTCFRYMAMNDYMVVGSGSDSVVEYVHVLHHGAQPACPVKKEGNKTRGKKHTAPQRRCCTCAPSVKQPSAAVARVS